MSGSNKFNTITISVLTEQVFKRDIIIVSKGIAMETKDETDILKAMRLADKHMYEDKDRFYTAHPDLVYRQ